MRLTVVDHTDEALSERVDNRKRNNGGLSYSQDIVGRHVAAWEQVTARLGAKRVTIGTFGHLDECSIADEIHGDLAVQYLHRYPEAEPVEHAKRIHNNLAHRFDRITFVTAHVTIQHALERAGLDALWVPMTIDATAVREHAQASVGNGRAVWLGNVTPARARMHRILSARFNQAGVPMDTISYELDQRSAWERAAAYSVGVAVSRSALELMAIGLPVMIAGNRFGGIVTTDDEWQVQTAANFGSNVITYTRLFDTCLDNIDRAITGRTNDIPLALEAIGRYS